MSSTTVFLHRDHKGSNQTINLNLIYRNQWQWPGFETDCASSCLEGTELIVYFLLPYYYGMVLYETQGWCDLSLYEGFQQIPTTHWSPRMNTVCEQTQGDVVGGDLFISMSFKRDNEDVQVHDVFTLSVFLSC